MEMLNEKCCEAVKMEGCGDKQALFNVNVCYGRCSNDENGNTSSGTGSDTYDHDRLENKNLGIQHNASAIGFADGDTFQEKYDKGELTGPHGPQGEQGLDLYGAWKMQDPENNTAPFEEWVRQSIGEAPFIPDYAKMETINRISTLGGSWEVDRDGFVYCFSSTAQAGQDTCISINDVIVSSGGSASSGFGNSHIFAVKRGDIVKIYNGGNKTPYGSWAPKCYYIPPRTVVSSEAKNDYSIAFQALQSKVDGLEQAVQDLKTIING